MAEKLAATHSGTDPEQPPEGARFVREPSAFPVGLVLAKEVVTSLTYDSVSAPRQREPYVGYIVGWPGLSGTTRWSMWPAPREWPKRKPHPIRQEGEELVNGAFTNGM